MTSVEGRPCGRCARLTFTASAADEPTRLLTVEVEYRGRCVLNSNGMIERQEDAPDGYRLHSRRRCAEVQAGQAHGAVHLGVVHDCPRCGTPVTAYMRRDPYRAAHGDVLTVLLEVKGGGAWFVDEHGVAYETHVSRSGRARHGSRRCKEASDARVVGAGTRVASGDR